jgi:DnaJ-domain-containing protein 1
MAFYANAVKMGQVVAMMKTVMTAFFALGLALFATGAEARGGGGSAEFMDFVADTTIPPSETGGAQVSLCHLVKKYTAIGIPLFYESEGYVLAENRCATESYYSFTAEEFALAQSLGMIPTDIPAAPSISLARRIPTVILGLCLLALIGAGINQARRKKARLAEMGNLGPFEQRLLEVLCHAAKSDGVTDAREVATIAAIAGQLTGSTFDADKITRMISLCQKNLQPTQFKAFAKGLTDSQKDAVMRGALMVLAADGQVGRDEQKFLNGLAGGLAVTQSRFDQIMASMQGPATA